MTKDPLWPATAARSDTAQRSGSEGRRSDRCSGVRISESVVRLGEESASGDNARKAARRVRPGSQIPNLMELVDGRQTLLVRMNPVRRMARRCMPKFARRRLTSESGRPRSVIRSNKSGRRRLPPSARRRSRSQGQGGRRDEPGAAENRCPDVAAAWRAVRLRNGAKSEPSSCRFGKGKMLNGCKVFRVADPRSSGKNKNHRVSTRE